MSTWVFSEMLPATICPVWSRNGRGLPGLEIQRVPAITTAEFTRIPMPIVATSLAFCPSVRRRFGFAGGGVCEDAVALASFPCGSCPDREGGAPVRPTTRSSSERAETTRPRSGAGSAFARAWLAIGSAISNASPAPVRCVLPNAPCRWGQRPAWALWRFGRRRASHALPDGPIERSSVGPSGGLRAWRRGRGLPLSTQRPESKIGRAVHSGRMSAASGSSVNRTR